MYTQATSHKPCMFTLYSGLSIIRIMMWIKFRASIHYRSCVRGLCKPGAVTLAQKCSPKSQKNNRSNKSFAAFIKLVSGFCCKLTSELLNLQVDL